MYILKNVARAELDRYVGQPTAKAMHERIMKDSVYVPKGDRTAAAVYVAGRNAEKAVNRTDQVEISHAGQELSRTEKEQGTAKSKENTPNIEFSFIRRGDTNWFSVSFANSAMVHRAVEQGYIELEGKQVVLSDDVKKQFIATNKQIQDAKKSVFMHNMLLHEAANARQTSDAMKEANDKMSRAMTTASRIMHGRKVSPADKKELIEFKR